MKRFFKKQIDERQEKELLQIGNTAFFLTWAALLVSLCVQGILHAGIAQILPEFLILMASCVYFVAACIRKGQWDYFTQPSRKVYLAYSAVAALICSGVTALMYDWSAPGKTSTRLLALCIVAVIVFVLCMAAMALAGWAVKKRRRKLEERFDEEK